jgi:hypothetical protein
MFPLDFHCRTLQMFVSESFDRIQSEIRAIELLPQAGFEFRNE